MDGRNFARGPARPRASSPLPLLLGAALGCAHPGPGPAAGRPAAQGDPGRAAGQPPAATPPGATAPATAPTARPAAGLAEVVKELIAHLRAADSAAIFALFGAEMKAAVPLDRLRALLEGLVVERGRLLSAEAVEVERDRGAYRLLAERGEWRLEVALGLDGKIAGLRIKEPPPPPPPVRRSEGPLTLPLRGAFAVFWGGDTKELNAHLDHPSQRRAADLLIMDEEGKTHRGEGRRNEDYYAYGKEVLAVAAGKVVTVVDGVPDNEPGSMNPYLAPGNLVIVEHREKGPGLYSVYAHLQPGRTRVKVGARVRAGEVLGRCGNSGNSSEPHLHFQVQDGPLFEKSWGVEAVFGDVEVTRDGKKARQAAYTFRKGDLVTAPGR